MSKVKVIISNEEGEVLEHFFVEGKQADENALAYEIRDRLEMRYETGDQK